MTSLTQVSCQPGPKVLETSVAKIAETEEELKALGVSHDEVDHLTDALLTGAEMVSEGNRTTQLNAFLKAAAIIAAGTTDANTVDLCCEVFRKLVERCHEQSRKAAN